MNEPYLIVMLCLGLYLVIQICIVPDLGYTDDMFRIGSIIIGGIAFGFMLIFSGVEGLGDDIVEIKPATNTRVGNDLIIQSDGWPTQVVSDIKFIDKPVQIKKVTPQNAWGGDLPAIYYIETVISEKVN